MVHHSDSGTFTMVNLHYSSPQTITISNTTAFTFLMVQFFPSYFKLFKQDKTKTNK